MGGYYALSILIHASEEGRCEANDSSASARYGEGYNDGYGETYS